MLGGSAPNSMRKHNKAGSPHLLHRSVTTVADEDSWVTAWSNARRVPDVRGSPAQRPRRSVPSSRPLQSRLVRGMNAPNVAERASGTSSTRHRLPGLGLVVAPIARYGGRRRIPRPRPTLRRRSGSCVQQLEAPGTRSSRRYLVSRRAVSRWCYPFFERCAQRDASASPGRAPGRIRTSDLRIRGPQH